MRLRQGELIPFLLAAAFVLSGGPAAAEPPEGADPMLGAWFRSLQQPGTGVSCCSVADCRPTDYRTGPAGYEALIDGRWLSVPDDKVLQRIDNPTGRAIVCYLPTRGIMCFVRPSES